MNAIQLDLLTFAWLDKAMPKVLAMEGEFTSDDLKERIPEPAHRNHWGVLLAKVRSQLVAIGYRASARKEANGRVVRVWRVK